MTEAGEFVHKSRARNHSSASSRVIDSNEISPGMVPLVPVGVDLGKTSAVSRVAPRNGFPIRPSTATDGSVGYPHHNHNTGRASPSLRTGGGGGGSRGGSRRPFRSASTKNPSGHRGVGPRASTPSPLGSFPNSPMGGYRQEPSPLVNGNGSSSRGGTSISRSASRSFSGDIPRVSPSPAAGAGKGSPDGPLDGVTSTGPSKDPVSTLLLLSNNDFDDDELSLFAGINDDGEDGSEDDTNRGGNTGQGTPARPRRRGRSTAPLELGKSTESIIRRTGPIRWERGAILGVGGFGKVYLGTNLDTGELMAVKTIEIGSTVAMKDARVKAEIILVENEINVLQFLEHENIVRYIGTSRIDRGSDPNSDIIPGLNIYMEYVSGGSLSSLIRRNGPLDESVARAYAFQILNGLKYLHEKKIAHRDIKPANILLSPEPYSSFCKSTLKIADFGASKNLNSLMAATEGGAKTLTGTPYYMSPEVVLQTGHGRKADIWSLGCTVYEMLVGKQPWADSSPMGVLFHIGTKKTPPPFPEGISPACVSVLRDMFTADPRDRPTAARLMSHPWFAGLQDPASLVATPSVAAVDTNLLTRADGTVAAAPSARASISPTSPPEVYTPGPDDERPIRPLLATVRAYFESNVSLDEFDPGQRAEIETFLSQTEGNYHVDEDDDDEYRFAERV